MPEKSGRHRGSRSVKLAGEQLKQYLTERGIKPSGGLRRNIRLGRIDRESFIPQMKRHMVAKRDWHRFLPEGGVAGVELPTGNTRDGKRVLVWFPGDHHITGTSYSPLTWAGAGPNDFIATEHSLDPATNGAIPRVPTDTSGDTPMLKLRFRHRVLGLDPMKSWWSAIVGFARGGHPLEWQTIDLTQFDRVKLFVRAYLIDASQDDARPPIPVLFRFEDDSIINVEGEALHPSSSWCRPPIDGVHWLRPSWISLADGFAWGENAFWPNSRPVDKRKILQITFGMDSDVPDVEGVIEIHRIELHGDSEIS